MLEGGAHCTEGGTLDVGIYGKAAISTIGIKQVGCQTDILFIEIALHNAEFRCHIGIRTIIIITRQDYTFIRRNNHFTQIPPGLIFTRNDSNRITGVGKFRSS